MRPLAFPKIFFFSPSSPEGTLCMSGSAELGSRVDWDFLREKKLPPALERFFVVAGLIGDLSST